MKNRNSISKIIKIIIFIFPIIAFIFFIITKIYFTDFYNYVNYEDNVTEYLQSIFLLICSILSLLISLKYFKNKKIFLSIIFIVFFIFFAFWFFEEISWGQRIFNINTTEFMLENNLQSEITIHNLRFFRGTYNYVHLAYLMMSSWGLFLPFIFFKKKKNQTIDLFYPEWYLSLYFLSSFIFYFYWEFLLEPLGIERNIIFFKENYFFTSTDQEPSELFLIIGIMFFLIIFRTKQNNLEWNSLRRKK